MADVHEEIPAVRLEGVAAGREGFRLGPVTCEIPKGYVTAIVGPNGSGKSTLFRLLLGLEPARDGRIEVLGTRVTPGGDDGYKARIGFLAENPHEWENGMTANEKAAFAALWYPGWNQTRFRELLDRFEVQPDQKLRKQSKGMRRKAELAVAMAHDAELLILDEPSSGLDPYAWKLLLAELQREMAGGDRTLLIATHITEEVRRLADYVLFLNRGRYHGLYEKDRLFDEWRSLTVQAAADAGGMAADERQLRGVPGCRGLEEVGRGVYRLDVCLPATGEAESAIRACGFQLLENRRMELEDILQRMIESDGTEEMVTKEEANVESA